MDGLLASGYVMWLIKNVQRLGQLFMHLVHTRRRLFFCIFANQWMQRQQVPGKSPVLSMELRKETLNTIYIHLQDMHGVYFLCVRPPVLLTG